MTSKILNISVDCARPFVLAQFWSEVLGRPIDPDNEVSDDEVGIPLAGGAELLFLRVPEGKTIKNRLHLCLEPDQLRDVETDRLRELGASLVADRREPDGSGWFVLADPEGNEFCVLRSDPERARESAGTES